MAQEWNGDKQTLDKAVASALDGYKGQVNERWHVIPVALKKFRASSRDIQEAIGAGSATFDYQTELIAGLSTANDEVICSRVYRLHQLNAKLFVDTYSYLTFDVQDAAGSIFHFEMIFNEGNGDANAGFFAVVWNRTSGVEVACCTHGGDMETKIEWTDSLLISQFVAHPGLCPRTSGKHLSRDEYDEEKDLHHEYFESSIGYSGIYCTHDDDKNQLELLIPVAAKLTEKRSKVFFPTSLPQQVLDHARAQHSKESASSAPHTWLWTSPHFSNALFMDHDVSYGFREEDQWDD